MPRDEELLVRPEVNVDRSFMLFFCVEAVGKTKVTLPPYAAVAKEISGLALDHTEPCQGPETKCPQFSKRLPLVTTSPALTL